MNGRFIHLLGPGLLPRLSTMMTFYFGGTPLTEVHIIMSDLVLEAGHFCFSKCEPLFFFVLGFFLAAPATCLQHVKVPKPGIKPVPQLPKSL